MIERKDIAVESKLTLSIYDSPCLSIIFNGVANITSAAKRRVYLREHCLAMTVSGILGSCKFYGISPIF